MGKIKIILLVFTCMSSINILKSQEESNILLDSLETLLFKESNTKIGIYENSDIINTINEHFLVVDSNFVIYRKQPNKQLIINVLDELLLYDNIDSTRFFLIYNKYMQLYFNNWKEFYLTNRTKIMRWINDDSLNIHIYIPHSFDCVAHAIIIGYKYDKPEYIYNYFKSMYMDVYNSSYSMKGESSNKRYYTYYVNEELQEFFKYVLMPPSLNYIKKYIEDLKTYFINDIINLDLTNALTKNRSIVQPNPMEEFVLRNIRSGIYYDISSNKLYKYYIDSLDKWFANGRGSAICRIIAKVDSNEKILRNAIRLISDIDSLKELNEEIDLKMVGFYYEDLLGDNIQNRHIIKDELLQILPGRLKSKQYDIIDLFKVYPQNDIVSLLINLPNNYNLNSEGIKIRNEVLKKFKYYYRYQLETNTKLDYVDISPDVYSLLVNELKNYKK